jgi:Domain of unknown function (DUF6456)
MTTNTTRTYRQHVGAKALEQEAARIFRRLVEANSYLARLGGHLNSQDGYGVFVSRNRHKKPVMKLTAGMFAGFKTSDWIVESNDGRWQLSPQGQAWLQRRLAGNDPYRAQHQLIGSKNIKNEHNILRKMTVNLGESPLGWLRHRKGSNGKALLSQEQYEAGERLRCDFEKAQMSPRITSDITNPMTSSSGKRSGDAGNGVAMQEAAMAAKERFFKALDAVGADLSDVLIEVCCHLKGMDEAEKQLRLPQRSGKIVLQIALTRLGQHYGLIAHASAHQYRSAALRHWGDDTYRPGI